MLQKPPVCQSAVLLLVLRENTLPCSTF